MNKKIFAPLLFFTVFFPVVSLADIGTDSNPPAPFPTPVSSGSSVGSRVPDANVEDDGDAAGTPAGTRVPVSGGASSGTPIPVSGGSYLPSTSTGKGWSLSTAQSSGLPRGSISGIVYNVMYWLLFILGIVGVIGFSISGIMYLISAGEQDMIDRAKRGMTYSIIGIIVGLMGLVIIKAVFNALSASPMI